MFYTVTGNGVGGFSGDGGGANLAEIWDPEGIVTDPCGNLFIADDANHRILKITFPSCGYLSLSADNIHASDSVIIWNVFL